jgi:hypothetical protein
MLHGAPHLGEILSVKDVIHAPCIVRSVNIGKFRYVQTIHSGARCIYVFQRPVQATLSSTIK